MQEGSPLHSSLRDAGSKDSSSLVLGEAGAGEFLGGQGGC